MQSVLTIMTVTTFNKKIFENFFHEKYDQDIVFLKKNFFLQSSATCFANKFLKWDFNIWIISSIF